MQEDSGSLPGSHIDRSYYVDKQYQRNGRFWKTGIEFTVELLDFEMLL